MIFFFVVSPLTTDGHLEIYTPLVGADKAFYAIYRYIFQLADCRLQSDTRFLIVDFICSVQRMVAPLTHHV